MVAAFPGEWRAWRPPETTRPPKAGPPPPRWIEYMPLDEIQPADVNVKRHDLDSIRTSILAVGYADAAILDERTGKLIGGHGRHEVLFELRSEGIVPRGITTDPDGRWLVPVQRGWASADDDEARTLLIAVNYIGERGGWDAEARDRMLVELHASAPDLLAATGYAPDIDRLLAAVAPGSLATAAVDAVDNARQGSPDRDYDDWDGNRGRAPRGQITPPTDTPPRPTLADRFLIPPFDVLDTRTGWWTARRRKWLDLGIRSELGRPANTRRYVGADVARDGTTEVVFAEPGEKGLTFRSASGRDPDYYLQKGIAEEALGRKLTAEEFEREHYVPSDKMPTGTSVFDPVLCELAYRWFCPPAGRVLDPFAGGSVRGLVAGMLGRSYLGVDLRREQTDANEEQLRDFVARGLVTGKWAPRWETGDAATWVDSLDPGALDFLLTCPPFMWLERYSDDPRDLSTMKLPAFEAAYRGILAGAARALAPDRFAVIVVGDVREVRGGRLHDLRGMTVRALEDAGLTLMSTAVVINHAGSLAVRAGRSFANGRTLGRHHQHAIVAVKGDWRAAARACGDVDVECPEQFDGEQ